MYPTLKVSTLRGVSTTLSPDETRWPVSVLGRSPFLRPCDSRLALSLCQKYGLSDMVGRLLALREVTLEDAPLFLKPSIKQSLPEPYLLQDMELASARLARAIIKQEPVTIFGDYDVDGSTATALLVRFLRAHSCPVDFYIPDRLSEGYGPSAPAMQKIAARGTKLVVTVDCGTVAFDAVDAANATGMEIMVIDHHLSAETLPEALAVVNPNRTDCTSGYNYLCAAGVAFLLAVATQRQLREAHWFASGREEANLMELLDLVALGTVCDVMPLKQLNRAYVTQGLRILSYRRNIGLSALSDIANANNAPPSAYTLGFVLGPRINAGGRIGASDLGVRLLTTEDPAEARDLAAQLNKLNTERQTLETVALEQALAKAQFASDNEPLLMLADHDAGGMWHQGIIGIVAGRLKDRFDKPTAILSHCKHEGKNAYKASCRSVPGVDFGSALANAKSKGLLVAGGGHAMAAGFTVLAEHKEALAAFLTEQFAAPFSRYRLEAGMPIDLVLTPASLHNGFAAELSALAPFGAGNPEPRLLLENAKAVVVEPMKGGHLRVILCENTKAGESTARLKAVAFRAEGTLLGEALLKAVGKPVRYIGRAKQNHFNGTTSTEFHIEDLVEAQ